MTLHMLERPGRSESIGRMPQPVRGTTVPGASRRAQAANGAFAYGHRLPAADGTPVGCPRRAPREGYRLGRWERLAMTVVVLGALVVVGMTVLRPVTPATQVVTVRPGDTLVSLIARELPGADMARAAELIEQMNGMRGADVTAGMRLVLPAPARQTSGS